MKVTFVTVCEYPDCDAGAKRFVYLSYAFRALGFDCFFIGRGFTPRNQVFKTSFGSYVSVRRVPKTDVFAKVCNRPFREADVVRYAIDHCGDSNVFVASQYFDPPLMKKLKKFCSLKNIKLIYAPMEFFSPTEFPFRGIFSVPFWRMKRFYRQFSPDTGRVISISSYLDDLFKKKGVISERIPFVYSNEWIKTPCPRERRNDKKLSLMYAGSPFRKDCLLNIIKGLELIDTSNIVFHVFGATDSWLKKKKLKKNEIDKIMTFCVFHGRVEPKIVINYYRFVDFTVLLRRGDETYAKAGFPTKITESLAYGVPVIANLSSDLGMYLIDGENAIVSSSEKPDDFARAVKKALLLDDVKLLEMRKRARTSAESGLESNAFADSIRRLLIDGD